MHFFYVNFGAAGTLTQELLLEINVAFFLKSKQVAIPLHQLRSVNPAASRANTGEKYIQVVSVDDHEFWFMGFVNYDSAVRILQEAVQDAH